MPHWNAELDVIADALGTLELLRSRLLLRGLYLGVRRSVWLMPQSHWLRGDKMIWALHAMQNLPRPLQKFWGVAKQKVGDRNQVWRHGSSSFPGKTIPPLPTSTLPYQPAADFDRYGTSLRLALALALGVERRKFQAMRLHDFNSVLKRSESLERLSRAPGDVAQ